MAIERTTPAGPAAGAAAGAAGEPATSAATSAAAGGEPSPVHVLTVEHGEHRESTLYRFEKGSVLQLYAGPSLLGRRVFLYTNYAPPGDEFSRNQYRALEWRCAGDGDGDGDGDGEGEGSPLGAGALLSTADAWCEVPLARPGSFHYYFVYDAPEAGARGPEGSGWFQVSPVLTVGGAVLPADGVCCQTVLAKCAGPLPRWEGVLRVARETGYNMVHFTPIQALGASRSCYSIADQLRLDPQFGDCGFDDVGALLDRLRDRWQMAFVCDVVLNHTANETSWLATRPEASYNCALCPHLRPAAALDALLARLGAEVARGEHVAAGLPPRVDTVERLDALRALLERRLPEARLHEMYCCDVTAEVRRFERAARDRLPADGGGEGGGAGDELRLAPDALRRRLRATIDMEAALRLYNVRRAECGDEAARVRRCGEELRRRLERLNEEAEAAMRDDLRAAVDNCVAGVRWERVDASGPRAGDATAERPLFAPYFTWDAELAADAERVLYGTEAGAGAARVMAHNGWVMDADPLRDFAAPPADGRVYLRRELVAWGDSVKLRYGEKPADSPFLWAHMRRYVELTAALFDGLRLDNCHSTPLHVAEYMLDAARAVRPDLYVMAELFTNSDQVDNIFVNRLGITSLIREASVAWDAHEQGRLVHRFGGRPVGAFLQGRRRPARGGVAPAMLLDLTHDNPPHLERRCLFDALPSSAIVSMACCATGSTRGYDELVPHHIHVVDESRLYATWADGEGGEGRVGLDAGIAAAKRALNELHRELAADGYSEVFVDQIDADVVAVTRHDPRSRRSIVAVAFTAFVAPAAEPATRAPRPLRFEGRLEGIALEARLRSVAGRPCEPPGPHARHPRYVDGLRGYEARVRRDLPLAESTVFAAERRDGGATVLEFRPIAPGVVCVLRVALDERARAALTEVRATLARGVDLEAALAPLDAVDFNALLYRCDAEEREAGGGGAYDVPGHGALAYAGLQGVASLLAEVTASDDLGHALCDNLRAGDWLPEYLWRRLEREPRLATVAARYRSALRPLGALPRYLVPAHFAALAGALHAAVCRAALGRMSGAARGDSFSRALALTSVQLTGAPPSAPLPRSAASLSAGLPHFATGYMRCWGRDTFVALRGLYLLTGRYEEARAHIVGFAACLRHGLIPNLLDGGRRPRYNCRDAVWWWLLAVTQYCDEAPRGGELLDAPVSRLYPTDDAEPAAVGESVVPLRDLVQEALDRHFQGVTFRERGAGRAIDAHMTDRGFVVRIGVDPETGFPVGGNDANCGTWMDKMGSSERAGTRGRPATPRDGSAVEIVGLAYAAVAWLAERHAAGRYPHAGVARLHPDGTVTRWTFAEWADRIRAHFERHFWVPGAPSAADARPDLVHRRAVYKDTHGAERAWADYQLRCNFPIAMAVAPRLFDARRAWRALDLAERLLVGPLGMKTLDPEDWAYRGDYDATNDGDDASVAHGFNYHQGPEWVWPLAFYLRARLAFAAEVGESARTVAAAYRALGPHLREIRTSPWRGLPELTNAGGAFCAGSCRTQAWSSGCVLEALRDLEAARRARPLLAD